MAKPLGFVHDAGARNDERMIMLRSVHGWEAIGIYWAIIESLREASDLKLTRSKASGFALVLGVTAEKLNSILETCFEEGLLSHDDTHYWSPSLTRRIREYDAKCQVLKDNGSKGGRPNNQMVSKPKPDANQTETKSGIQESVIQSNKEGGAGETKKPDAPELPANCPPHLKTESVKNALNLYRQALKRKYNRDFDEISIEALLASYGGRTAEELAKNLNYSAQLPYKTVCEAPPRQAEPPKDPPPRPHPKIYEPPPKATPEQMAAASRKIKELLGKTKTMEATK